jgi:CBS domain-containing protein
LIIKDCCSTEVAIARADETLVDAAIRMKNLHVGTLVVIEHQDRLRLPIGIVTDRDLVVKGLARHPQEIGALKVADVMSKDLIVAREDEPAEDVLRSMRSQGIRRVPVVDFSGDLIGIFAFDDYVELISKEMSDLAKLIVREREREASRT